MGKPLKRYTPEFRRQMVEPHRTGRSFNELAKEFGCTTWSIRQWVKQAERDAGRGDGGVYLAIVLDVWSRKVVGWAMATHLRTAFESISRSSRSRRFSRRWRSTRGLDCHTWLPCGTLTSIATTRRRDRRLAAAGMEHGAPPTGQRPGRRPAAALPAPAGGGPGTARARSTAFPP